MFLAEKLKSLFLVVVFKQASFLNEKTKEGEHKWFEFHGWAQVKDL